MEIRGFLIKDNVCVCVCVCVCVPAFVVAGVMLQVMHVGEDARG
jgi:hypothetical protein